MKFAIINDIHIGFPGSGLEKGVQRKLVSQAKRILSELVEKINVKENPEFVVNLGDSIEDVNNKDVDTQLFRKTISILSNLKMPVYWLIGNHDIRTLTEKEISEILGYEKMYYSFDYGSYHFVALSFEMIGDHKRVLSDIAASISQEQVKWLKADLSKTEKSTIVFVHYGLADDNMKGNFWFELKPDKALLKNREQIRKILEESGKVKAVISAHQHWNKIHIHNNIAYFVVTSPTENFKNDGIPSEAYTIVNLVEGKIIVEVKGNDPARFEHSF